MRNKPFCEDLALKLNTVKQVNFAGNLILRILWTAQVWKIELPQNCTFNIDSFPFSRY